MISITFYGCCYSWSFAICAVLQQSKPCIPGLMNTPILVVLVGPRSCPRKLWHIGGFLRQSNEIVDPCAYSTYCTSRYEVTGGLKEGREGGGEGQGGLKKHPPPDLSGYFI